MVVGIVSCEKVIDVPLNESDRRIIVEAVGRSFEGESYILLSKSGSVYDDGGFEKLSGATVSITDQTGEVTVFTEDLLEPGRYIAPTFVVTANNTYDLSIEYDGTALTAQSKSFSLPTIDSLNYIETTGFGGGTDTTYLVFYNYTDNAAETNYYRIRPIVNGKKDNNYYLADDRLGNGQQLTAPIFGTDVGPGDTVLIELLSMDADAYEYLFTLSSTLTSGAFGAAPANPVSNIEGDGIGYFGVYMVDTMSIIMPE
jgi:hypothetical protein